MKILLAHNLWADSARSYFDRIISSELPDGVSVTPFVATPNAPASRLSWAELDRRNFFKDKKLMRYRDSLIEAASGADVFWLYNGANFHPDWLALLPKDQLKVFSCFDDPESTHELSASVAPYFDMCLIGNIATLPLYQSVGCKDVHWIPIFPNSLFPVFSKKEFFSQSREHDLIFFGERVSSFRKDRLEILATNFPDGKFHGRGWPAGYINDIARLDYYKNAKIGINIHNSIGPVNSRLFELPGFGTLQICDNKCRLGQIFDLDTEVIGFDTITEAVDLINFYLQPQNELKRLNIAWNGYQKATSCYSHKAIWEKAVNLFSNFDKKQSKNVELPENYLNDIKTEGKKVLFDCSLLYQDVKRVLRTASKHNPQPPILNKDTILSWTARELAPSYLPNDEYGACNFDAKSKRVVDGGHWEWPNMVALNWLVASVVGNSKKILEVGSGTGCFAYEAGADPKRQIICFEADSKARAWAERYRSRPNVVYTDGLLSDVTDDYDLTVAIDVVEHLSNYSSFLNSCSRVSRKSIFTTPNRFREDPPRITPLYEQHVQEWSAGEFYWTLKSFWKYVYLLGMPNPYVPICRPIDVNSSDSQIIAVCSHEELL